MAAVYNTVSALVIEQLTGQKTTVRLVGRGLPYRPFNLKTTQRVELTWLPGSSKATATVLGPSEEPTEINGVWKDKFIDYTSPTPPSGAPAVTIDSSPAGGVRDVVDIIDDIVRQGQPVKVTWDLDTREGFLQEFNKKWLTTHDVEWSMKFIWTDRGEPDVPAVTQEVSLFDFVSGMKALLADLDTRISFPAFAFVLDLFAKLKAATQRLADYISQAQNAVSTVVTAAFAPFNAAKAVIAACTGIIGAATDIVSLAQSQVSGAFDYGTYKSLSNVFSTQSPTDQAKTALFVSDIVELANMIKRNAVDQRAATTKIVNKGVNAVYVARQGDDLRDVSRIYYSTPNQWRAIMIFNGLSSAELVAGQVVLIPVAPISSYGSTV